MFLMRLLMMINCDSAVMMLLLTALFITINPVQGQSRVRSDIARNSSSASIAYSVHLYNYVVKAGTGVNVMAPMRPVPRNLRWTSYAIDEALSSDAVPSSSAEEYSRRFSEKCQQRVRRPCTEIYSINAARRSLSLSNVSLGQGDILRVYVGTEGGFSSQFVHRRYRLANETLPYNDQSADENNDDDQADVDRFETSDISNPNYAIYLSVYDGHLCSLSSRPQVVSYGDALSLRGEVTMNGYWKPTLFFRNEYDGHEYKAETTDCSTPLRPSRSGRSFGWWWANQFVFKRVQRRLSFDRCIEVHSAGDFMMPRTANFFSGLNIVILTDYGSSECSGPHAVSLLDRQRAGCCGVEMDGCRTRFVPVNKTTFAEMRAKGRIVFMGYLNGPERTEEAFDEDGWYRTTDLGYRDESGFLYITASIDELFTLTDGRVVSPVPIELAIKDQLPCIGHCMACGNDRPYVVMLLTFDAATEDQTNAPLDVVSKRAKRWLRKHKIAVSAISEMANNPPQQLVTQVQSVVDKINTTTLDYTTAIQKWKFLPRDFSIPTGELNPSHRMKRSSILELYAVPIESLYDGYDGR